MINFCGTPAGPIALSRPEPKYDQVAIPDGWNWAIEGSCNLKMA